MSGILVNNGQTIYSLYPKLVDTIPGSSTIAETITAINNNLSHLDTTQNQMNTFNNVNQEALLKQQQLLKTTNARRDLKQ